MSHGPTCITDLIRNKMSLSENLDDSDSETSTKEENCLQNDPYENPMQFEDIIESLGSFGSWQRIIFFTICLADIFGALGILLPMFTASTPQWVCVNSSTNASALLEQKTCHVGNNSCDVRQYDDDFTSAVSQWDLVCEKYFVSDLISSIQMAGLLVGAFFGGQASDTFGRKVTYFGTCAFLMLPGFVSAFSVSWQMFAVCRFFVGIGYGSLVVVNCVYPLEFVGRRWRAFCGTVGFWAAGEMLLALAAYLLRDWRHLTIVTSAPGILYFATWWYLPESPRWLVQKRRFSEAHEILSDIAKRNGRPCPDLSSLHKFCDHDENERTRVRQYTYLDLFRSWKYCRTTLVSMAAWFSSCLIYAVLSFNMRRYSGDRYLNVFFAGAVDLLVMLSVIPLSEKLGRRWSYFVYICCSLVCNIAMMCIFVTGAGLDVLIVVCAVIGRSSALGGIYLCQIYTAEIYPTVIRNVGLGASSSSGRIGNIIAPQLVLLGTMYAPAPYIVSMLLCVLVLPLIFTLPETKDRALQDRLQLTKDIIGKAYEDAKEYDIKEKDEKV